MNQPELFSFHYRSMTGTCQVEPLAPFAAGSETSQQAAERVQRGAKAKQDRQAILDLLYARGEYGATDEEMQLALGLSGDSLRPRRWELRKAGKVELSGKTRQLRSGNKGGVWILARQGGAP